MMNIKELAEGTSGPVRAALLALEAKVMMLEHDLAEAIEQHEAYKQEVSDAAEQYNDAAAPMGWEGFDRFIIKPKLDPLVEALADTYGASLVNIEDFRAALEAWGLEIREKNDD